MTTMERIELLRSFHDHVRAMREAGFDQQTLVGLLGAEYLNGPRVEPAEVQPRELPVGYPFHD